MSTPLNPNTSSTSSPDSIQVIYEGHTYLIEKVTSYPRIQHWIGSINGVVRTGPQMRYIHVIRILAGEEENALYNLLKQAILEYLESKKMKSNEK